MFARAARPEGPERLPALRPAASGHGQLSARLAALLAAVLLLAAGLGACGGDDEPESGTTRTLPELTQPAGEPTETVETPPEIETVEPEPIPEPVPTDDSGGTPAPTPEPPADSPDNDVPPPTDSPAERFEEFCNDNPGACG